MGEFHGLKLPKRPDIVRFGKAARDAALLRNLRNVEGVFSRLKLGGDVDAVTFDAVQLDAAVTHDDPLVGVAREGLAPKV